MSENNLNTSIDLGAVTDEVLIDEIERRKLRLAASIWSYVDLVDRIIDDERCSDLDDNKIREIAEMFIADHGEDLVDKLSDRGSEIIDTRWEQFKDEILKKAGVSSLHAA